MACPVQLDNRQSNSPLGKYQTGGFDPGKGHVTMQIKMKPGKPTEPGDYVCKRKGSSYYELTHVWLGRYGGKELLMFGSLSGKFPLSHLEDDAIFSERIDLIVENQ